MPATAAGRRVVDRAVAAGAEVAQGTVSSCHTPRFSASPASDAASGPGNSSGNSVTTVARQGVVRSGACSGVGAGSVTGAVLLTAVTEPG